MSQTSSYPIQPATHPSLECGKWKAMELQKSPLSFGRIFIPCWITMDMNSALQVLNSAIKAAPVVG